ncbi:MAG: flavodoxin family protein [Thermodesulfobacteriota bacterium]|nr:flavodoxin family protein [Thermodesulfobacteriota bacterium]
MKIFAVNGSPNMKKGMTHILLEDFLEGAREAGAEVETVLLQKKKINYCLGCFDCWVKTPGVCVHKDDMPELMEKARQADCIVIGTPLYVDGMTAQTKTFLDRMIPLVDPHFELVDGHYRHPPRSGRNPADIILVSVCGFYERDNFDGLIDHMERMCRNMQSRFVGAVVRPSSYIFTLEKILGEQIKEIREATRRAGREFVEKGTLSPQVLDDVSRDYLPKDLMLKGANDFWDKCIKVGKLLSA